jgi:hypothetical protein
LGWKAVLRRHWPEKARRTTSIQASPEKTGSPEKLDLFVFTQLRTQNRCPLLLELL